MYGPGGDLEGGKTNYDFSVFSGLDCKAWLRHPVEKNRLFGEDTQFRATDVTDGLSSTFAVAETLRQVYNGRGNAWGYRAWVMMGIDVGLNRINIYQWPNVIHEPSRSQLATHSSAGSLHGEGANFLMADGSAHYLVEATDRSVLESLSTISGEELVTLP